MSNFPQHQGTLFLGVMNLVPTTKCTTETSTSSRRWWWISFFLRSVRVFGTNIPEKCYFPNVGGIVLTSHFEGGIREPLRFARSNFFRFEKKKEKMTKIQAKNRVRDVTGSFEICETHPIDIKKQGGKRFPSQFHRSNFVQNCTKNEMSTDIHGLVHNGRFWADFGQICVAFWVTIRNLLDFSHRGLDFFPDYILFP